MNDAIKAAVEIVAQMSGGGDRSGSGGIPKIPESVLQTVGEAAAKHGPAVGSAVGKIALETIRIITRR